MFSLFRNFKKNESGAVTVDWVVLTAAVVGISASLVIELRGGSVAITEKTGTFLADIEIE